MIERIQAALGFDLRELAGASFTGDVPLSRALINTVIAQQLARQRGSGKVAAVVVEPLEGDRLLVSVRLRSSFVPPLRVLLAMVAQPELPDSPVLVLRWSLEGGLGPLAKLAGPALSIFDVLPPGVRVDGDLIGIDVAAILRDKDAGSLLPYIRQLRVRTRQDRVLVHLELQVPDPS